MKRFTIKTKEAARLLLSSKSFSQAEVASLLSVQLKSIKQLANEKKENNHVAR